MRRTREWWARLTKDERARLVYLERSANLGGGYGGGGYLPDDCCECGSCGTPSTSSGLCPICLDDLIVLVAKADGQAA